MLRVESWPSVLDVLRVGSSRSVLDRGGPCWIAAVRAVLDVSRVGSSRSVLVVCPAVLDRAGPCRVVLSRVGGPCRVAHGSVIMPTKVG